MKTSSLFKRILAAALAASAAAASAADFPTDAAAVITTPGTYVATGDLGWTSLAVGGAGAFLFDLSGGPYTATLTGTGQNVMTLNAKDTDLTLKGGTWNFTGASPYFNQSGGTRGVNRRLTLDGATVTGLAMFYAAYGGGDSDATVILTNGASLTAKQVYPYGYGAGSLRTRIEIWNGSTVTATATSGAVVRSDDSANGAALGERILIDGTGSSLVSKGHVTIGNSASDVACEVRNGASLDVTGKQLVLGNGSTCRDDVLIVTNNATVACDQLRVGSANGAHANRVLIADGSTATVGTLYMGAWYGGTGTYGNTCEVHNATLTCTKVDFGGALNSNNLLRIAGGTGSFTVANSWKQLTDKGSYNVFEFTNGASWKSVTNWGTGSGHDNEVRVLDNSTLDFTGYNFNIGPTSPTSGAYGDSLRLGSGSTLTANNLTLNNTDTRFDASNATVTCSSFGVGASADAHGNRATIVGGTTFKTSSFYLGAWYNGTGTSGNACEVSDSTFDCSAITMTGANCISNVFRMTGAASELKTGSTWKELTDAGRHNRFVLDGATWTPASNWRIGEGVSNEVAFVNGATADFTGYTFGAGPCDSTFAHHGDRLVVGAGATLKASAFQLMGNGTSLVVSNGTVQALSASLTSWSDGLQLGFANRDYGYDSTNLVVTLQGDRPLIKSAGYVTPRSNTRIVFEIPEGGYAKDHVPITGVRIVFHHGNAVLVPKVDAFREGLAAKTDVTLVRATGSDAPFTPGTVIADSNALAPKGCTFRVGSDGKSIVLTVKPPKRGFAMWLK